MKTVSGIFTHLAAKALTAFVLLTVPVMTLWAQEMNKKFSMTTQIFLNRQKALAEEAVSGKPHRVAERRLPDGTLLWQPPRLVASADTVGGEVYMSCFIHLHDAGDLDAVRGLGVKVEETFEDLGFVTALVPVGQLDALAAIGNVTSIKAAQLMRPLTDVSRQLTHVDDLLGPSASALAQGVGSQYDGSGVVLGIIDTGIDFQHIAFKDKDGNSRIKQAYIYDGSSTKEYNETNISYATTDDDTQDHGTHTASTAGGSSVVVSGTGVTVTDDHAAATYGGMAPGADLYLAGIKGLKDTYLINALKKMVAYADEEGKPLVVSNSWGSSVGPRDGTGELAELVGQHFGDSHPDHIILFAASNDAGHRANNEDGGFFVKKSDVSSASPLGSVIRSNRYGGYYYGGMIASAIASKKMNCIIYVLDSTSGNVLTSWSLTEPTSTFSGLDAYYTGEMGVLFEENNGKYVVAVYSEDGIRSTGSYDYTLAIEIFPSSGTADVSMWAGDRSYFTDCLTTSGHVWTKGTDDMCVSDEATIPDAISVGAYVSKKSWKAASGLSHTANAYTLGDIAYFSSYATAEMSPTGEAYPWITAPGARLAAGVNHYHTASVDDDSYYGDDNIEDLVVNNANYPYAMMEGTSMATPVAAGIVALWLQAAREENMELTVNDVKDIMKQTAIQDEFTSGSNASHFGHGKIDALAGIQYILQKAASIEPTPSGETLLYEGMSKYSKENDGSTAIAIDNTSLDSDQWSSFTRVFSGGISKAYSNGGCMKLGNSSNYGEMVTKEIALYGNGTLTFYLKKYSNDTGKLKVTVTGATADKTSFTPASEWMLCTVRLTKANGKVTISFATSARRAYIDEITLTGGISLALVDNGSNSTAISTAVASHGKYDVTLSGRTLYKDGEWNTLCLPFDVTLAGSPLDGAIAKTLADATMTATTVGLTFGEAVTTLQAGVPYIIKWEKANGYDEADPTTRDITSPVFANVTVKSGSPAEISMADDHVKFIGYYDAFNIDTPANDDIYYMTSGNTLKHTGKARTLLACRAYFQFSEAAQTREFVLDFGDNDVVTGITTTNLSDKTNEDGVWYTLDGRRLDGQPLMKGVYIQNGRKVIR